MTEATSKLPALVGMVHLAPLPGAPQFGGSIDAVVDDALTRARQLVEAGFPALMVENFGDVPFYADDVPPVTIAAITRCVSHIAAEVDVPIGVNVLRNDGIAAVAIAGVTGAAMLRVNVLSGLMQTDQGPIVGRAAEVVRHRREVAPDTRIWADVMVKHASPPPGLTLEQSADDTWHRGGADALVLSGAGTGHAPDLDAFRKVRATVADAPLVVGSGATLDNLASLAELADHIIVGTALEVDDVPGAPLDPARLDRFVEAAASVGLV